MYTAFQSNNDSSETEVFSINAPGMREMVDIAALNSRVKFDKTDVPFDQRQILGDATETGLTRFAGRQIADYDGVRGAMERKYEEVAGHQPGDPAKAMRVLADVVRGEGVAAGKEWPLYLPLGVEAEVAIRGKCKRVTGVLDVWGDVIRDTRLDNP